MKKDAERQVLVSVQYDDDYPDTYRWVKFRWWKPSHWSAVKRTKDLT